MASPTTQARSLYRRLLRELPTRTPSILANPSPIQQHIRTNFVEAPSSEKPQQTILDESEQYVSYLKAQRLYITLVERYNPGMNMSEEERVRLSARRVGVNLPVEHMMGGNGTKDE